MERRMVTSWQEERQQHQDGRIVRDVVAGAVAMGEGAEERVPDHMMTMETAQDGHGAECNIVEDAATIGQLESKEVLLTGRL